MCYFPFFSFRGMDCLQRNLFSLKKHIPMRRFVRPSHKATFCLASAQTPTRKCLRDSDAILFHILITGGFVKRSFWFLTKMLLLLFLSVSVGKKSKPRHFGTYNQQTNETFAMHGGKRILNTRRYTTFCYCFRLPSISSKP